MSTKELLQEQIKSARDSFGGTVADLKEEHVHTDPGGLALPLGSLYAHLILSEDIIVHGMLQEKAPLSSTEWKDKTGADKPMPSFEGPNWSKENTEWSKTVTVDLVALREYAKAVYKKNRFLSSQSEGGRVRKRNGLRKYGEIYGCSNYKWIFDRTY